MSKSSTRTNDQWLADLHPNNPNRDTAIADLRQILLTGLPYALSGWVQTLGPQFDALAEDFVQDALLKILDNLDSFRGDSKFTTWAHKITVRVGLTELRRKRWRNFSLDYLTTTDDGDTLTPTYTADSAPTPSQTTEQNDLMTHVQRILLEELTPKQRQVIIAARIQNIPMDQVAHEMGMNRNALYKLLHDARIRLKKRLASEGLTPEQILASF
ncbi:MAG TPA: sigma-70 family RNA polymerase sigma factor [Anaerolineae bacterium]|nr:sigma-70 family RNA polymerase sigma factor [Anaerolineae bacterium]